MDDIGGCMGASLRWERWDAKGRAVIVDPGASQAVVPSVPVKTMPPHLYLLRRNLFKR